MGESITAPRGGAVIQPVEYLVIEHSLGRGQAEMAALIDFVAVVCMENVERKAKLILDGMLPVEKLADELIRAVMEKRHLG